MSKHTLPSLPYSADALEPFIDTKTMQIHHGKHHAAYVDKLNAALEKYPSLYDISVQDLMRRLSTVPSEIAAAVTNHGGGHANHSFFWPLLEKNNGPLSKGPLQNALAKQFDSFDGFQSKFTTAGMGHFGSGWVWLSLEKRGSLVIHCTPNQNSPLSEGLEPVLGLDLWEHAYYLKHQNRRNEYIDAFWNVVNWKQTESNFAAAREKRGIR